MKTLIIFNDIESPLQYLIVEGDFSRFHGVMVNAVNGNGYEEEFCKFVWNDETGERNHKWSDDKSLIEGKAWDKVAVTIFIP